LYKRREERRWECELALAKIVIIINHLLMLQFANYNAYNGVCVQIACLKKIIEICNGGFKKIAIKN
jgi:hypothetical protein